MTLLQQDLQESPSKVNSSRMLHKTLRAARSTYSLCRKQIHLFTEAALLWARLCDTPWYLLQTRTTFISCSRFSLLILLLIPVQMAEFDSWCFTSGTVMQILTTGPTMFRNRRADWRHALSKRNVPVFMPAPWYTSLFLFRFVTIVPRHVNCAKFSEQVIVSFLFF